MDPLLRYATPPTRLVASAWTSGVEEPVRRAMLATADTIDAVAETADSALSPAIHRAQAVKTAAVDLTAAEMSSPPLATVAATARDFAAALSDLAATVAARVVVAYGDAERSRRGTLTGAALTASRVVAALTATVTVGVATWVMAMHDGDGDGRGGGGGGGKQHQHSRLRAAVNLCFSLSGAVLAARAVLALLHWTDSVYAKMQSPPKPHTHNRRPISQAGNRTPSAGVDHHPSPVAMTGKAWSPPTPPLSSSSSSAAIGAGISDGTDTARLTALVELYADDAPAEAAAHPGDAGPTDPRDLAALVEKYADNQAGEEQASISPPVAPHQW
ncbi:hypothetical protein MMPV_005543 [Pyropia vietnamensis]